LSIHDFCRQEGFSEPSFYAWRRKIAQRDVTARKDDGPSTARLATPVTSLLPVKVNFSADKKWLKTFFCWPGAAGRGPAQRREGF